MDGSAFLLNRTDFSSFPETGSGILYVEDFDLDPVADRAETSHKPAETASPDPVFTLADLDTAREEGRLAGLSAALDDANLLAAQIQAAATQSLTDALGAAQAALTKIARQTAEDGVRVIVAVLQAALPALMEQHAAGETEAVLRALLAGIAFEPELRVRVHPNAAESVRELLACQLPHGTAILSVTAEGALAPGDIQLAWRDGGAARDTGQIWDAIRGALAPLNLPTIEEVCSNVRH